jgi:predicted nucleic acid-binding protein
LIIYFDTSAFVPLLIAEPGTAFCRRLWDDADAVVTSRLLYVETAAALAQGLRMERLTEQEHRSTLQLHQQLWQEFDIVEADEFVVNRAADLASELALRGYDAVHCASAEQVDEPDLVVASGDQRLLGTCAHLGLATADANDPP